MSGDKKERRVSERQQAVRDKIQREVERAKEEKRREQLQRRIDLAKMGLKSFETKEYKEAIKQFLTYISILHDWKKVPERSLNPTHFNIKTDIHEILLISTVYWHMMKMFDRSKSPGAMEDFRHYTNQFILFTKGMPFQPIATETLRKYIRANRPVHMSEFKAAYKMITGSSCFVATSLVDLIEDDSLSDLRRYRDSILARSTGGRLFIWVYGAIGPVMALLLDRCPQGVRAFVARAIDWSARRAARVT